MVLTGDVLDGRRYQRYKVDLMSISGKMARTAEVKLLGISTDEVTLKADMRLNLGSHYTLKLHGNSRSIVMNGTVLGSLLTETKKGSSGDVIPLYKATMKLGRVSPEALQQLTALIESSITASSDGTHSITADAEGNERALLHFPEGYKVKQISVGGMLIETESAAARESRFPMEIFLTKKQTIMFYGRVASCLRIPGKTPERYNIGIEFQDMKQQDRENLAEFIQTLDTA
jgi:hypothetical protein